MVVVIFGKKWDDVNVHKRILCKSYHFTLGCYFEESSDDSFAVSIRYKGNSKGKVTGPIEINYMTSLDVQRCFPKIRTSNLWVVLRSEIIVFKLLSCNLT